MKTLYDVQVGDMLINETRYSSVIVRVDRITPQRIVINNGCVYHKKNGERVGNSDIWTTNFVRIPKDNEIEELIKRNAIVNIGRKAKEFLDKGKMTYEQALKLKEILNL